MNYLNLTKEIPDGFYFAEIVKIRYQRSKNGRNMLVLYYRLLDAACSELLQKFNISFPNDAAIAYMQFKPKLPSCLFYLVPYYGASDIVGYMQKFNLATNITLDNVYSENTLRDAEEDFRHLIILTYKKTTGNFMNFKTIAVYKK